MDHSASDIIRTLIITAIVNLTGGALAVCAAIYLARFKFNFMRELDERFLKRPDLAEDLPMTRREALLLQAENEKSHARYDKAIDELWRRINREKL